MELIKKLPNGTEYYRMDDGRFGAIYPSTGYARVSYAIDKKNDGRALRQRLRNYEAYLKDKVGQELIYQINPVKQLIQYQELTLPLFFKSGGDLVHYNAPTWRKVYYKYEGKQRVLYPNDREALFTLLSNFNAKNCQP